MEAHGIVQICVHEEELKILFGFHLVTKQAELIYSRILGRDFLQDTKPKYVTIVITVTFKTDTQEWTKEIFCSEIVRGTNETGKLLYLGDQK
jgi:hypothetical protein